MISKTKSYTTDDGKVFANLEAAQIHEIERLLGESDMMCKLMPTSNSSESVAGYLVSKKDALLAILSTKERKARVAKVKPERKKKVPTHQQSAMEVVAAN